MRFSRPHGDTGEADPAVTAALDAYARGTASERDTLTTIAGSRLLVPVVAVLTEATQEGTAGSGVDDPPAPPRNTGEKETEMALPTLIGNDGRKAVIAFTGTQALRRWRADARPVPVPALRVWEAARGEAADAVVVDVAGPVPLTVEGARLRALAANLPLPPPHEDPDIRAEVAAITPRFTLGPGEQGADLVVTLEDTDAAQARLVASQIAARLGARLRRGFQVRAPR